MNMYRECEHKEKLRDHICRATHTIHSHYISAVTPPSRLKMSLNSGSTILDEPHLPVPGSPSALGTWLFDAETSNNDSDVSFGNGPLTTSTTSTKPGSECEYLIDTDSEPGYGTPSPCEILNSRLSTMNAQAPRSETPVSDPGLTYFPGKPPIPWKPPKSYFCVDSTYT